MINKNTAIVGGGIIGLAMGYKLSRKYPNTSTITISKKSSTLDFTSQEEISGVLHCGLHYEPGSLKARLAVGGIRANGTFL